MRSETPSPSPIILWACDPGKHKNALAIFHRGVLIWVGFVPSNRALAPVPCAVELVTEQMRVYPKAPKKRDPNDLLAVERAAGRLEGIVLAAGGKISPPYLAADWKGQIDKPTHHLRLWDTVLTDAERAAVAACIGLSVEAVRAKIYAAVRHKAATGEVEGYDWAAHNLFDAIGIGLCHLKRVGKAGLRARHVLNR